MTTKKAKCTSTEIKIALARKHNSHSSRDYFLTEVKSGATWDGNNLRILDAIAIHKSWANPRITGYEVKVSRSDFKGDAKFYTYLPLVHALYIVTPTGVIKREELPLEIGLIWYDPETKRLITKKKPPPRQIEISADLLRYIIFSRLEPDRIPFYSDEAEYWKDWLQNKKDNKHLGSRVAGRLREEFERMESELRREKRFSGGGERERYEKLLKVMERHGMQNWVYEPDLWLNDRLKMGYSEKIYSLELALKNALSDVEKIKAEMKNGEGQN